MPLSSQGYEDHFAARRQQEDSAFKRCSNPDHVLGCPCCLGLSAILTNAAKARDRQMELGLDLSDWAPGEVTEAFGR